MSADTIAAIATAPGRGAVAIVRISGPEAFAIGERLTGRRPTPREVRFARFRDAAGRTLDEGLMLAFAAPRSYTGEDVVELQGHGGTLPPARVVAAALAAGARLARRGEFTERAFLNGRLSLEQSEAVIDLIDARTERSADAALAALAGRFERACRELYARTLALSAELEHALDVDEGELAGDFLARIDAERQAIAGAIRDQVRRLKEGRLLREGALVVIAGEPNVGKSSLMNALLGFPRAIVAAVPGTTRDSIEEWLDVGGWPVRLVDTAGLRETTDAVEAEGVRRSTALVGNAALVLRLSDRPAGRPSSARELAVRTKGDLLTAAERAAATANGELVVSAKAGEGLDELRTAIAGRLSGLAATADEAAGETVRLSVLERSLALLEAADVQESVLVANAVRQAATTLGEALGAEYSSDLLDRLFSRFCVGK